MKLALTALLLGITFPGCAPKAPDEYFMAKRPSEVYDTSKPEVFVYKPGESIALIAGGKGYAGRRLQVEYWKEGRKYDETPVSTGPEKGAVAWSHKVRQVGPVQLGANTTFTARLLVDGKMSREIVLRVER